jgi:uncharacterized membrane protein YkgB
MMLLSIILFVWLKMIIYCSLSLSLKNMFLNDPEESGWFYANQTQLVYCCFGIIQHISLLLLQLF